MRTQSKSIEPSLPALSESQVIKVIDTVITCVKLKRTKVVAMVVVIIDRMRVDNELYLELGHENMSGARIIGQLLHLDDTLTWTEEYGNKIVFNGCNCLSFSLDLNPETNRSQVVRSKLND